MFSLQDAYGNATTAQFYGGLDRAEFPMWQGLVVPATTPPGAPAGTPPGSILTRAAFIPYLLQAAKYNGGEALDFVVMSVEDWTTLMTDFMSVERYNNDPTSRWGKDDPVNSGFRGLLLGDTPIFFDLNCPKGMAFGFNSKYITLVIHEDANFAWTGWYSTIPQGQIASVGLTLTALNLVCSKPSTGIIIEGIAGGQSFVPQVPWPVPPPGNAMPPVVQPIQPFVAPAGQSAQIPTGPTTLGEGSAPGTPARNRRGRQPTPPAE
jgi:hypothetical protein